MAGFSGLGTILRMSTGDELAPDTEVDGVAELTNISGPTMSAEEIDVSSFDSDGGYREFVAGFLDAGEISIEGNLIVAAASTVNSLAAAFNDGVVRNFHVVFPTTGTGPASDGSDGFLRWIFNGTVTGVETAAPYDDKAGFSATIRITGSTSPWGGAGPVLVASATSGY